MGLLRTPLRIPNRHILKRLGSAQAAPSESRSRAALIYWRRRGDRHLVKARKRVRNEKGMSAADRRLVGAPFDFNALQISGSEALAEKRYKRAAVLLRRAIRVVRNLQKLRTRVGRLIAATTTHAK